MKIRFMNAEISDNYIYPGEVLYIKCGFEALEDFPASSPLKLFAEFDLGHQRTDPDMKKYYRTEEEMYPQPMFYRKGETYYSTIRWVLPESVWAGTYKVTVGMCDELRKCVPFECNGTEDERFFAGTFDVAFAGIAKNFVNSNKKSVFFDFGTVFGAKVQRTDAVDMLIKIRDKSDDKNIYRRASLKPGSVYEDGYVKFSFKLSDDKYCICDIFEKDGFEFLSAEAATLFIEKAKYLFNVNGGGRKIDVEKAMPWGYGNKYYTRNIGLICADNDVLAVETPYLDDIIHYSICEICGEKYASLGVTFTYRIRANGKYESLKVINTPTAEFKRIKGGVNDCLEYLRRGIKKSDNGKRKMLYYFTMYSPGEQEASTFEMAKEYARRVYNMTGGIKQYMLMRGWQHQGHDTGYPDVFTVCDKCGTLEDAENAVNTAYEKYNAKMIFHDNYDDMYLENEFFNPEIAALDDNGNYYKSWIWNSGNAIITGYKKSYNKGILQKRVKRTVDMLPLHGNHHIDVLSQEVRRYDFAPDSMSAAEETLKYKRLLADEYKKYGITISSEGVTHPFVNYIPMYWRLCPKTVHCFSDEISYPLMAMIYHGKVHYTDAGAGNGEIINAAQMTPPGRGFNCYDRLDDFKRDYWIKTFPMSFLNDETYDDYSKDGALHIMTFSNNGKVVYDEKNDTLTVTANGKIITENGNTFGDGFAEGEYLGYTESGKIRVAFSKDIKLLYELDTNGFKKPLDYTLKDGYLELDVKPNTGFKIISR